MLLSEKIQRLDGDVEAILEQAEVEMKYSGYINKQEELVEKLGRLERVVIPSDIDYSKFAGLSSESKEKLSAVMPTTLGQASRISGIKPSDISILMVYLGR